MRERERGAVYPERLNLKVPAGTVEALASLARAQQRTTSEVVRDLLRAELRGRGLLTPTVQP